MCLTSVVLITLKPLWNWMLLRALSMAASGRAVVGDSLPS